MSGVFELVAGGGEGPEHEVAQTFSTRELAEAARDGIEARWLNMGLHPPELHVRERGETTAGAMLEVVKHQRDEYREHIRAEREVLIGRIRELEADRSFLCEQVEEAEKAWRNAEANAIAKTHDRDLYRDRAEKAEAAAAALNEALRGQVRLEEALRAQIREFQQEAADRMKSFSEQASGMSQEELSEMIESVKAHAKLRDEP